MKSLLLCCVFTCLSLAGYSQSPVGWNFDAYKISNNEFRVVITASIDEGWHIYSQFTPKIAGLPSQISFNKNPIVSLKGKVKEEGHLIKNFEPIYNADIKYFEKEVVFSQVAAVKSKAKTNISGVVKFMACKDGRCLPPEAVKFNIPLK